MATKKKAAKKVAKKAAPQGRKAFRDATGVVDVGRLGSETVTVEATKGLTVGGALTAAGVSFGEERIMLNGAVAEQSAPVKAGDLVLVLTPKQAGAC